MNIIEAFTKLKENPNTVMKFKCNSIIYNCDDNKFYQIEFYERGDGLFDEDLCEIELKDYTFCLEEILSND